MPGVVGLDGVAGAGRYSNQILYRKGAVTVVSASEARASLFRLIEQVNEDSAPVEITSRRGGAVLISRQEFDALEETAHLLRSPANAARLVGSLAQARAGEVAAHELLP